MRWTLATTCGFVLGGVALHSPGASGIGASYLEWDVGAAVFGAILGSIVGVITGILQMIALGVRSWRLVTASVVAVAIAHALADGAPAVWGFGVVAALSERLPKQKFVESTDLEAGEAPTTGRRRYARTFPSP